MLSSPAACVLGIDVGGTGSRAVLVAAGEQRNDERMPLAGARPKVDADGSSAASVVLGLAVQARRAHPDARIVGVGAGVTGLASLVDDPARLAHDLARAVGAPTAVATDAVTAHLGALGGAAGAVIAIGTGAIALGTDFDGVWRRVGGWGHLWDDRGSGAWIGIEALKLAIARFDGVELPSRADPSSELRGTAAALLDAAVTRFGAPPSWPGTILGRPDRAGLIAALASDVADLADGGDAAASALLIEAGEHAGRTLAAALDPALPPLAAATGGVLGSARYAEALERTLRSLRPDAKFTTAAGSPLDGAVLLAERAATQAMRSRPPFVWTGSHAF